MKTSKSKTAVTLSPGVSNNTSNPQTTTLGQTSFAQKAGSQGSKSMVSQPSLMAATSTALMMRPLLSWEPEKPSSMVCHQIVAQLKLFPEHVSELTVATDDDIFQADLSAASTFPHPPILSQLERISRAEMCALSSNPLSPRCTRSFSTSTTGLWRP